MIPLVENTPGRWSSSGRRIGVSGESCAMLLLCELCEGLVAEYRVPGTCVLVKDESVLAFGVLFSDWVAM